MTEQHYTLDDNGFKIVIPMDEEYRAYLEEEPNTDTARDSIHYMINRKIHPATMAQHVLIAETVGNTKQEIIGTPKVVLKAGAAARYSNLLNGLKTEGHTPSGNPVQVREIVRAVVGVTEEEPEEDDTPVDKDKPRMLPDDRMPVFVTNHLAAQRALQYLKRKVPGYVQGRLAILAVAEGEEAVRNAAYELKMAIDAIVEVLCK